MPHHFIRLDATSPNPGLRARDDVRAICEKHHGTFENFWHDQPNNPRSAYVLVKDGDVDGMLDDLQAQEVVRLYETRQ